MWFKPDPEIFTELTYDYDTLANRLRELSFLNKGVEIHIRDEREGRQKDEMFLAKGGLKEMVAYLNTARKPLHNEVVYIETERDDVEIELAFQYNDGYNENVFSFVNNINTHEGGTHLTGFKSALTRTINAYASKNATKKGGDVTLSGDDVREGLTAVLSVKVREPQFEGQTKTKLGNSEVEGAVKTVVNEMLGAYLEEHPRVANIVIEKAVSAARAREAARKARDLTRKSQRSISATFRASSLTVRSAIPLFARSISSRETAPAARQSRDATARSRRFFRCAARFSMSSALVSTRFLATRKSAPSSRRSVLASRKSSRSRTSATTRSF